MIKNIVIVWALLILIASCSQEVLVDNPSKNDIELTVKGKQITVKANSIQKIKVDKGVNDVLSISSQGDTLLAVNVIVDGEGILNVTQTTYAVWKDVFCEEEDYESFKNKLNLKDTVELNGLEFVDIDLEIVNEPFIAKTWDIGLEKEMPETIEIGDQEKFKIVSKIYRENDLKKVFNYYGDYDFKGLTEEEINKVLNNQ